MGYVVHLCHNIADSLEKCTTECSFLVFLLAFRGYNMFIVGNANEIENAFQAFETKHKCDNNATTNKGKIIMDELASTLLDRINGLAKKSLKAGGELTDEQHRSALVRITENVRLIKKLEKVASNDDDDTDEDVVPAAEPRTRSQRRSGIPQAV